MPPSARRRAETMSGFSQRLRPQKFRDKLKARQFVITAEITPPVSCAREDLVALARPLIGFADAVNVTDGAGAQPHVSALAAASIVAAEGVEPIVQFVCRDKNRIALQSDLMAAATLNLRNLLILRGDDPPAGDQPETKPVFDLDPVGLIRTAAALRDRGEFPYGRKVKGRADFFLGAADAPIDPPAGWKPQGLIAKMNAGAEIGALGALDARAALRHDHAGARNRAHGARRRSAGGRPPQRVGADRAICENPRRRRGPHHGPVERRGDSG